MPVESTITPALLTKAVLRVTDQLAIAPDLAPLLSISKEEAAKLQAGERSLEPSAEEWGRAQKLVGLFRTLVSLLGSAERARTWLAESNEKLASRPIELLRTADAERVHRYVDAVLKHELRMPSAAGDHRTNR